MNGVSKKLTIAGVSIGALITVIKAEPNILAYIVVAGIVVITLAAIGSQTYLDYQEKSNTKKS